MICLYIFNFLSSLTPSNTMILEGCFSSLLGFCTNFCLEVLPLAQQHLVTKRVFAVTSPQIPIPVLHPLQRFHVLRD